jgi:glycosyltransferase involved in cell wall biosynthesis
MVYCNDELKILVCMPAYNEAKSIADIIRRAKTYAAEVIVCDDGSYDTTYEVAKAAGATVIRHPTNKGYGAAIRTLFQAAREKNADIMVTLDSDGQHDPNQIPDILEPILNDTFDIVVGSRFLTDKDKKKVPMYRSIGIKTITRLTQLASYSYLSDAQSGFRAYNKNALSKIYIFEDGMSVLTEILFRAKEKNLLIKEIPITIDYNVEEPSTYNPLSQGAGVLFSIIQFISLRHPLAFYGLPGIALLIISSVFINNTLELFHATRYISTNMILIAVGTATIGVVLLVCGTILYTISALLKGRIKNI